MPRNSPSAPSAPLALVRELGAFLRRPQVLRPSGLRSTPAWRALAMLLVLHVAVMLLAVLPAISLWQKQFGLPMPDAFGKLPRGWLLPITVLVAPVLEEAIFRGWQSGRPRALWLLACFAAFVVLVTTARAVAPLTLLGMLVALAAAAIGGWLWLRKRPPLRLFAAVYPAIFWLVALGFAAVHLMNYPSWSLASLPMVLPQLWAAMVLGFTRQRLGLPAAMLQHAGANAAAMALSMVG